jgi:hypothetical protein
MARAANKKAYGCLKAQHVLPNGTRGQQEGLAASKQGTCCQKPNRRPGYQQAQHMLA